MSIFLSRFYLFVLYFVLFICLCYIKSKILVYYNIKSQILLYYNINFKFRNTILVNSFIILKSNFFSRNLSWFHLCYFLLIPNYKITLYSINKIYQLLNHIPKGSNIHKWNFIKTSSRWHFFDLIEIPSNFGKFPNLEQTSFILISIEGQHWVFEVVTF